MSNFINRRRFLTGLAAAPLAAAIPFPSLTAASVQTNAIVQNELSLKRVAAIGGRYFGAAARIDQIDQDPLLRNTLLRDCSWITPEIHLNWDAIEWNPGQLKFGLADQLVAFATREGLQVHGHTLLWDQSTPGWAKEAMLQSGDWSPIRRHFASVMTRYQDQITQWNVINEPIDANERKDGLRTNTFLRAFGPDYIRRALDEARSVSPTARLMINDFSFDYENPVDRKRRYLFLKLLERLKKSGTPLDMIGIQAHLDLSKGNINQKAIARFLGEIAAFDLDIIISELDVTENQFSMSLKERDRRVAQEVKTYLDAALSERAVQGVITWGLSDVHSWLQDEKINKPRSTAEMTDKVKPWLNRGLPYDATLGKKPMYDALASAFTARAVS